MGMRTILIGDGETHEPAKSHAPKNYFRIAVQRDRRVCPVIAKNQLPFSRKICFSAHVLIPPRGAFWPIERADVPSAVPCSYIDNHRAIFSEDSTIIGGIGRIAEVSARRSGHVGAIALP